MDEIADYTRFVSVHPAIAAVLQRTSHIVNIPQGLPLVEIRTCEKARISR